MNAFIKFGEIRSFIFKILSGKEILTSIKGHNSVTNVRKMIHRSCQYECIYKIGEILSKCVSRYSPETKL